MFIILFGLVPERMILLYINYCSYCYCYHHWSFIIAPVVIVVVTVVTNKIQAPPAAQLIAQGVADI